MGMAKKYLFDVSFDEVAEKTEPTTVVPKRPSRAHRSRKRAAPHRPRDAASASPKRTRPPRPRPRPRSTRLPPAFPPFIATQDAHSAEIQRQAIAALRIIVAKALPAFAACEPLAEIEALAEKCLMEAIDEPRVVLRVANEVYDAVRERLDAIAAASGYGGRIVLLADDTSFRRRRPHRMGRWRRRAPARRSVERNRRGSGADRRSLRHADTAFPARRMSMTENQNMPLNELEGDSPAASRVAPAKRQGSRSGLRHPGQDLGRARHAPTCR